VDQEAAVSGEPIGGALTQAQGLRLKNSVSSFSPPYFARISLKLAGYTCEPHWPDRTRLMEVSLDEHC